MASGIGSIVGAQEGMEAGLVISGLAAAEHRMGKAFVVGMVATAAGVVGGHQIGESALTFSDHFIGDGGVGFLPSVAIGGSILWHNLRTKTPQQSTERIVKAVPYVLGAGFAAFEGVEAGILTSTVQSSLVSSEATTLGVAAATFGSFSIIKSLASKVSPKNALRSARALALAPTLYLAGKATPELISNPKPVGLGIAALGTTAVVGAVGSFFKKPKQKSATKQTA